LGLVGTVLRRVRKAAHYSRDEVVANLTRLGSRAKVRERLVHLVRTRPSDFFRWFDLARDCDLGGDIPALVASHRLHRANTYLIRASSYIEDAVRPALTELAARLTAANAPQVAEKAIIEIIRWKTIVHCREDHAGGSGGYFAEAEKVMPWQWENVIWPIVRDCDFTATLDLGCGYGRNTEFLRRHAKTIDLVDINETCLQGCRERFGDHRDGCSFRYHATLGNGLPTIPDRSITLFYSWDTMVHFDKIVMRDYLREITRILAPGGRGFLHYSNLGAERPNSDLATNHGHRSDMSGDLFSQYAAENGLRVIFHRLSGKADGWGRDSLDCLTLIER
jgi:ubiquinone/menaquinone biosynthesis C-methylase UbiE